MLAYRTVRAGFLGAALALVPVAAEAVEPVKTLGKTFFTGECVRANGIANRGLLCIRRDPASVPGRLRYYFTFDGLWSHMNIRVLQTQSELSRQPGNRTITITRSMGRNALHTIWVQACNRPMFSTSECTFWIQLRIRA